ncbi:PhzF family phenazine biosynthesis protein [Vibrio furnissii]|uniref:PhzF family phenazine biosynthesis protein n=1 Tax=Vibrio furnissii TaxID=29494 RepID=UPI0018EEFEB7|nr:PhzF family phenazine biosynthesis protein [Vibrio furnissii]MCG6210893.1 PhzF family phenazine biosynthesis protein [Vibrio furnissii]
MELELFVVDAFTTERFKGNSAAVVPVTHWLSDAQMLAIAQENNLSETAFIKRLAANRYAIRWFSPLTEIDFCGHATLASAYVLFNHFACDAPLNFETAAVGTLSVTQTADKRITMRLPNRAPQPVDDIPAPLLAGLSITPDEVWLSPQAYFAVYHDEQAVLEVLRDNEQLKQLAPYDVVATAQSSDYDFISRYFWPANGGDEDPVTGSIHAGLAPFWGERLGKTELVAYQASHRGGVLQCDWQGEHVMVSGHGVLYLHGTIQVD